MKLRQITVWGVVSALAAYGHPTGPGVVAGQYHLKSLDGDVLPFCCNSQADSGSIFACELELGGSAGADKYTWRMTRAGVQGYEVRIVQFVFSTGTYTRRGQELTLRDSTNLGRVAGKTSGDLIVVTTNDHQHALWYVVGRRAL